MKCDFVIYNVRRDDNILSNQTKVKDNAVLYCVGNAVAHINANKENENNTSDQLALIYKIK